jgi:hypothetical protein
MSSTTPQVKDSDLWNHVKADQISCSKKAWLIVFNRLLRQVPPHTPSGSSKISDTGLVVFGSASVGLAPRDIDVLVVSNDPNWSQTKRPPSASARVGQSYMYHLRDKLFSCLRAIDDISLVPKANLAVECKLGAKHPVITVSSSVINVTEEMQCKVPPGSYTMPKMDFAGSDSTIGFFQSLFEHVHYASFPSLQTLCCCFKRFLRDGKTDLEVKGSITSFGYMMFLIKWIFDKKDKFEGDLKHALNVQWPVREDDGSGVDVQVCFRYFSASCSSTEPDGKLSLGDIKDRMWKMQQQGKNDSEDDGGNGVFFDRTSAFPEVKVFPKSSDHDLVSVFVDFLRDFASGLKDGSIQKMYSPFDLRPFDGMFFFLGDCLCVY